MNSKFIIFVGLVLLGIIAILKLASWNSRRYYRNLLQGHLREDYIRKNPELVRHGKATCYCGNTTILLRNFWRSGSDAIREHICNQCGTILYYSVNGEPFESIVRELRKETCCVPSTPVPAPSK